jgi:hypothetical protein
MDAKSGMNLAQKVNRLLCYEVSRDIQDSPARLKSTQYFANFNRCYRSDITCAMVRNGEKRAVQSKH